MSDGPPGGVTSLGDDLVGVCDADSAPCELLVVASFGLSILVHDIPVPGSPKVVVCRPLLCRVLRAPGTPALTLMPFLPKFSRNHLPIPMLRRNRMLYLLISHLPAFNVTRSFISRLGLAQVRVLEDCHFFA
jgi:hypothetical protein